MKTISKIILLGVIIIWSNPGFSQSENDLLDCFLWLYGGGVCSNQHEDIEQGEGGERESLTGFTMGVKVNRPFSETFSMESGVLATAKGSKFSGGEDGYTYEDKLRMVYVDVPLKAQFSPKQSGFGIQAGVQPSVLVSAKSTNKMPGTSENTETVTDQFKTLDVAAVVGAEYVLKNGLHISAGYDHGLVDINKSENNDFDYLKTYNRVLKLSVGYEIGKNNSRKRAAKKDE